MNQILKSKSTNLNNNSKALEDSENAVKIIKDNLDISKKFLSGIK